MKKIFLFLWSFTLLFAAQTSAQPFTAFKVEVTGKGKPILLIPGYSCSGDVWKETVDHLKQRYECHVFTLAGYAGVPAIDTPVLKTVRDEIIRYVKTKQITKPMLIGHSLGAFMSLWISSLEPGLFGKMICVDGVPFISAMADSTVTAGAIKNDPRYDAAATAKSFENIPDSGYIDQNTKAMLFQVNDTLRARQIATWGYTCDRKTLGYTLVEMSTTDLRQNIKKITQPVLVLGSLYGNEANSYRILQHQYRNLQNKTIHVANSKHFIMYDQPDWFYNEIDSFLK